MAGWRDPARQAAAEARKAEALAMPIDEVAGRLGVAGLRRVTALEQVGPCPVCGGRDRFGINTGRNLFVCRPDAGGDQIALVQHVLGCDFRAALDFLVGAEDVAPDPAEVARRREAAEARRRKQEDEAERYRARAVRDAREIWHAAEGHDTDPARAYLAGRGVTFPAWPPSIRVLPAHPYKKKIAGRWREIHRGPCMVSAVQDPRGRVRAVHQTWLDPAGPKGKAAISADGEAFPAKVTRGSVKGGAVRLSASPPPGGSGVLVIGEGIETTGAALVAGGIPRATYWAGVSLGNMAGRQMPGGQGVPDLSDAAAFVVPPWADGLVLLQDGDSDPRKTRAALMSCARRAYAARPSGLWVRIVHPGAGVDLGDILEQKKEIEG